MNNLRRIYIALIATSLGVVLFQPYAHAFIPGGYRAWATGGKSHKAMTKDTLDTFYMSYGFSQNGLTPLTRSMKDARDKIADANAEADDRHPNESAWHCDAENLQSCSDRIRNLVQATVNALNVDNALAARTAIGSALHVLQDFYSHSNWIELGNTSPHPQLGRGIISNVAPQNELTCIISDFPGPSACAINNIDTNYLTSGYFGGQDRTPFYSIGKCRHGGAFDSTPGETFTGGINKDSSTCVIPPIIISPHSDQNPEAESVAIQASIDVFSDIKSRVTERQFKALLGIGPSLAFAIDTTGSMGGEIDGVKQDVQNIIASRTGTPDEPSLYILSPFNDPSVGPLTSTNDPNQFQIALNSLYAYGGGDCPELSMTGAYAAIAASDEGGKVFLYTDASSLDESLQGNVNGLAQQKHVTLFYALYGSCSPYDPAYFSTANRTGGQVFLLPRGQTSGMSQLANLLSRSTAVDILSVAGSLNEPTVTQPFPVDSTTKRITVSVTVNDPLQTPEWIFDSDTYTWSFGCPTESPSTISIIRPNGSTISSTDTDVTPVPITPTCGSAVIYSIANPQVGNWNISISGSGNYSEIVNGDSNLALDSFRFVRQGGRPGHEGFYPIDGLPLVGQVQNAIAILSGNPKSVSFELRTKDGQKLRVFDLSSPKSADGELLGELTVPSQPFVVYAVGLDENDKAFQRVLPTQMTPQTISITPPVTVGLGKDQDTTYIFQVKNTGIGDMFTFSVFDDDTYIINVTPNSASIPLNGTVNVKVVLHPPASAVTGSTNTLTFTAQSSSNPEVSNSAVLVSSVVDSVLLGDVNRDGKLNCDDLLLVKASFGSKTGSTAFNPAVDMDNNGIVDIRDLSLVARKLPAGLKCQ